MPNRACCLMSAAFCCLFLGWVGLVSARPRTSVKTVQLRAENPKGTKSHLVLPYAFPSESMGVVAGIGGGIKGYGQDQLLVGGERLSVVLTALSDCFSDSGTIGLLLPTGFFSALRE